VRYLLPETLREFARERLPDDEAIEHRRRHRDWYQALVHRAAAAWFTRDQVNVFNTLRREHANVRTALGFCLKEPDEVGVGVGLQMASELRFYWLMSGSLSEGRHWLDRLLARYATRDLVRLDALRVNGHLAALLNDYDAAESLLEEARTLAEELGDRRGRAGVIQTCGLSALFQGDAPRAAELLGEALEEHSALGDRATVAYDKVQLALATVMLEDHDQALELIQGSLRICEPSGENWTTALALFALGVEACRKGDQELATNSGRQSIRLRLPLHDRRSVGLNFEALAWSAASSGDGVRAARLFGAAQAIQQAIGTSLRALGHLARLHEEYEPKAREAIGDDRFERERQAGLEMEFDKAVDYALGEEAEPEPAPRPTAADAIAGMVPLTRREREVAALIAKGMSNKDIASALVISQRTAEGHVEHILAKLNFTSRSQVAAWIAQQTSRSS
jgi:non-specific serine/threonine protein kinase